MKGRGYLVLGPEGAGNRMTTSLLIEAGCYHVPGPPVPGKRPLVGRSVPHGREWPDIRKLLGILDVQDPWAVVVAREPIALARSQVREGHAETVDLATRNICRAYSWTVTELNRLQVPWILSIYEAMGREEYQRQLTGLLGLEPTSIPWFDGNAKHYGEGVS